MSSICILYIYICTDVYRYVRVLWMLTVHPWGSELRHPQSGRPQERERYHVEGLFLALRAVDNHVLVFAVRHSSSFGLMCGWIFAGSPQIVSEKSVAKKKGFMSFLVRGWLFDSSSGFVYWSSGFLIHILRKIISIICMGILYSVNIYIFTIYSQSIHNIFTIYSHQVVVFRECSPATRPAVEERLGGSSCHLTSLDWRNHPKRCFRFLVMTNSSPWYRWP